MDCDFFGVFQKNSGGSDRKEAEVITLKISHLKIIWLNHQN